MATMSMATSITMMIWEVLMSNAEDLALRQAHPLYAAWEEPDLGDYPEEDYDPYAEAEAMWEIYNER